MTATTPTIRQPVLTGQAAERHGHLRDAVNSQIRPGDYCSDNLSELDLAREFVALNGRNWVFDHRAGAFYNFDGARWQRDEVDIIVHDVGEHARAAAVRFQGRKASVSAALVRGVLTFIKANPAIRVTSEIFDAAPMVLGTPDCYVDLDLGEPFGAHPEFYVRKVTSVAPVWERPTRWLEFLSEAMGGDQELIGYLQRAMGYILTGSTEMQMLFFFYGAGKNGKSTFADTVQAILGDYAVTAAMDSFTAGSGDRHPTDLARLEGARFVVASETEEGRSWSESRIKQLTGGDRVAARYMRQDFFEFTPRFKLLIVGNYQPALRNVDEAMRRRLHIVPWLQTPARPDPRLKEKLAEEAGQILAWAIEGARLWRRDGLEKPAKVVGATDRYFEEQDVVGHWLTERCYVGPGMFVPSRALFDSWKGFAADNGEQVGTMKALAAALQKRGFERDRRADQRGFKGLAVKVQGAGGG
jgi:putative DNA primase/helicase